MLKIYRSDIRHQCGGVHHHEGGLDTNYGFIILLIKQLCVVYSYYKTCISLHSLFIKLSLKLI